MIYYKVTTHNNTLHENFIIEANNKIEAMQIANSYDRGYPIKVEKMELKSDSLKFFSTVIDKKILQSSIESLSMLLNSNISIDTALRFIIEDMKNKKIKNIYIQILRNIEMGQTPYNAFYPFSDTFGHMFISMLKISEVNGKLNLMIEDAIKTQKDIDLIKERFKKSIQYPFIVMVSIIFAFFILFIYVIPNFETLFNSYNHQLPFLTLQLINLSSFLSEYAIILLLTAILLLSLTILIYKNSLDFRFIVDKTILRFPIVGEIITHYHLSLFFLIIFRLHNANISINNAIMYASSSISNLYIQINLLKINRYLLKGLTIYEAFSRVEILDDISLNIIKSSKKSNNINMSFEYISKIKSKYILNKADNISTILEPLLIFIIGAFILLIALGLFIPLWSLSTVIR